MDEDLEVSSSDEEELLSLPMNEEDLLKLSDDDCREGRPKAQPSCSMDFNLETDAAGPSTAQVKVQFPKMIRNGILMVIFDHNKVLKL